MAHETVPADIAMAIRQLVHVSLDAHKLDSPMAANRNIRNGIEALEAAILHHLRNANEMKAALERIEQGV